MEAPARPFSVFSPLTTMLFAQLSPSLGLNDVCDWLQLKAPALGRFGVPPPSRHALSHAHRTRAAAFVVQRFWSLLGELPSNHPRFATGRRGRGTLPRFRGRIPAGDSSVLQLLAHSMDGAKHRRRKAAAKLPLRLDLHNFLPSFLIVGTARPPDNPRARALGAGLRDGESVIFDQAYGAYGHRADLTEHGVPWVPRAKANLDFRALKNLPAGGHLIKDQSVLGRRPDGGRMRIRRVEAGGKIDKQRRVLACIPHNPEWSPRTVGDLSQRRRDLEVCFKPVKQGLKPGSFPGDNENAVVGPVCSAMIVYVLLRFLAQRSSGSGVFVRRFALVRPALGERIDLAEHRRSQGTAPEPFRIRGGLDSAWWPGLAPGKA